MMSYKGVLKMFHYFESQTLVYDFILFIALLTKYKIKRYLPIFILISLGWGLTIVDA